MLNLKQRGQHFFFKMFAVISSNIPAPRDLNLKLLYIRYNYNWHIKVSDTMITTRHANKNSG